MPPQSARSRRFTPRDRIGAKYRLKRRLAVGGMGEIWVATNEATGADVALKVLRPDSDKTGQEHERFRHEARLSATLSHRNIIRIFDLVEESDGTLVLVMELLRGETLHQYLAREGPRSCREGIAILSPILSGLEHAHRAGIVHRDVTPANIFLAVDPDGQVTPKLVDFGIAKVPRHGMSPQTLDGRVLGTPRYMSPEQIRSAPDIDGRCDLFGVGIVLYEVLTGASPFAAATPQASLAAVLEAPVDPDPRIEPRVWLEVQRALSKRPYERHASADELAQALRGALDETEASLAATLRDVHPLVAPGDSADDAAGPAPPGTQTHSIAGHSMVTRIPKRRLGWVAWLAGAVVLGTIGLVATLLSRRAPATAAAPAASSAISAAATPSVPAPSASAAPQPQASTPAADAPSASAARVTTAVNPSARAIVPPRATGTATARTKPVATTPGF